MGLADINARRYPPEVVAVLLEPYSGGARLAIMSEASTWLYGNVESAVFRYERLRNWARPMSAEVIRWHSAGAWHANDLLKLAALADELASRSEPRDGPMTAP